MRRRVIVYVVVAAGLLIGTAVATAGTLPRTPEDQTSYLAARIAETDYVDHMADLFGYSTTLDKLAAESVMEASLARGIFYCHELDIAERGVATAANPEAPRPYADRNEYLRIELETDVFGMGVYGWQVREMTAAVVFLCPRHSDLLEPDPL